MANGRKLMLKRKCFSFILLFCVISFNSLLMAQDKGLVNTSDSPYAKLHSINMNDVQWTRGFWAERSEVARTSMVPHMGQLLRDPKISHAFRNFQIATTLKGRIHKGTFLPDGDCYKWFECLASVYTVTQEDSLVPVMNHIIEVIAKAQRPDGYIFTKLTIARQNGDTDAEPLEHAFETYNLGHLMTAAVVHHRATGKRSLLEVAIEATDVLYEVDGKS